MHFILLTLITFTDLIHMKQHLKSSMFLLLMSSLLVAACKKERLDDLTPGAKAPAGSNVWFRCKANGTAVEGTTLQVFQTNGSGTSTTLWSYNLVAELGSGKYFNFLSQNLQGQKVATQTYDMSTTSSQNIASVQYNDGSTTWVSSTGAALGTWTISRISGNSTEGHFSLTLRNITSTDSVVITEGTYSTNNYAEI